MAVQQLPLQLLNERCPHRRTGVRWWRCERFCRAAAGSAQLRQTVKARGWVRKRWGGSRSRSQACLSTFYPAHLREQGSDGEAGGSPVSMMGMAMVDVSAVPAAGGMGQGTGHGHHGVSAHENHHPHGPSTEQIAK